MTDQADTTTTPTPLLGLVMIVKDEAHGIEDTLRSFLPYIDRWTVLDTGSTDGTQLVVRSVLAAVEGELIEGPFVDFSSARNRALDAHGTKTVFSFMPDADDLLVRGDALRSFLESEREGSDPAFGVDLHRGSLRYALPILFRTKSEWRYQGRVHECTGIATRTLPIVELHQHHRKEQSAEASRRRWERDRLLLEEDKELRPQDARVAFYLAQTYECLGMNEEAIAEYDRRIAIGGFHDETFEALYRKAKMMARAKRPWAAIMNAYLEAHAFDGRRGEPLYMIAEHYHQNDRHPLTHLFAKRAADLPFPSTGFFVEHEIYEGKAADLAAIAGFYLPDAAAKAGGKQAAEKALSFHPDDNRLRHNRAFYASSARDVFGATFRSIDVKDGLQPGFVAMNPSVHFDNGSWRCLVRSTNYRIVNGAYLTPDDNVIQTHNLLLMLEEDLSTRSAHSIADTIVHLRTDYPVHGYEDGRLFRVGDEWWVTATVCDFSHDEHGRRDLVGLRLTRADSADEYRFDRAHVFEGPWSRHAQKNWMPISSTEGTEARLLYSIAPSTTVRFDTKTCEHRWEGETPDAMNVHLRGGSQLVPFDDGWLCLTHDVSFSGYARTYLHRFVYLDEAMRIRSMTDPFHFTKMGIEFCAGLGYDGTRLVASFSVDDSQANFAIFDASRVRSALRTDYVV